MTTHGMRRLVVSVLSAAVVALAATTAGAQQGPAGPQGGQQATQGGGITFQTTPADIGQRFRRAARRLPAPCGRSSTPTPPT
jgi:Spy/CpxP family protein refolding chaperone